MEYLDPLKHLHGAISKADAMGEPHTCSNQCGDRRYIRQHFAHALFYVVKSARLNQVYRWDFCSPDCREAWICSGGGHSTHEGEIFAAGLWEVHHPGNEHLVHEFSNLEKGHRWVEQGQSHTPRFLCSHNPAHAADSARFDRDIMVAEVEWNPRDPVPMIFKWHPGEPFQITHPHCLVDMHRHACPHALNDWFRAPVSREEHRARRAQFCLSMSRLRV